MAEYCADAGVLHAPHGKTTMAPALWSRQLEAGAWGITVANVPQLRVGRAFGVRRLHLANALVDPAALSWISAELDADPSFGFSCWVDSWRAVVLMDDALRARGAQRPLDVFIELGAPGGRTGAREIEDALEIAKPTSCPPARSSPRSSISTRSCASTRASRWRSAMWSGSASRTPARPSTSGR